MKKNSKRLELLSKFEELIDYTFTDKTLLNKALTHSSYANEHKTTNISFNERLEFLGDSVLSLIVSDYIYKKYSKFPEGDLTKLRAAVVCETSLAFISKRLSLGEYLLLGKGEEATGGRERTSILADALEALIGAIYLDSSFEYSRRFVIRILENEIIKASKVDDLFTDYKTKLQETLQKTSKSKIEYKIDKEEGPDHEKIFFMSANVESKTFGRGWGRSKKEAEQMAAKEALNRMGVYYE